MKTRSFFLWLLCLWLPFFAHAEEKAPVLIGLDAEFGHLTSTSDDAVKRGILIAIDEINRSGGVLGGRPLKLVERDNRSVPARAGAQAIIVATNESEGAVLVKEVASLPRAERVPLISHWGVTGGDLPKMTGAALREVDFSVVQTYSFIGARREKARLVIDAAVRLSGIADVRQIPSPVGMAHAYDLTHILALSIHRAGTTDRVALRNALEEVKNYSGLIKDYRQPFSAARHEALAPEDVFMARYDEDGAIVRVEK